jgi:uncharacterized protein
MEIWTAFLLGLVGSAHCAGMCGPLALALPGSGGAPSSFFAGRLLYNAGRVCTYMLLGACFGLLGKAFVIAGLQRWLSVTAGAAILLFLVAPSPTGSGGWPGKAVNALKTRLGRLFSRGAMRALFVIGLLNGLLPCGLVYAACGAAMAAGDAFSGACYMAAFGLGTAPMMLAVSLSGAKLQLALRLKLLRLIPFALALTGSLLVLRGLGLGIPWVSPDLPAHPAADVHACH